MAAKQDKPGDSVEQECSMPEGLRLDYLNAMGIQSWSIKYPGIVEPEQVAGCAIVQVVDSVSEVQTEIAAMPISHMGWEPLQAQVTDCQLCGLHTTRTRTVFGAGSTDAELFVIGEAPVQDEESAGEPCVGEAGQLLDAMLGAIGLERQQIYIANVIKCRPPNDRKPQTSEIICCDAYLQRQIELIKPKVILVLGQVAAQHLLVTQGPLTQLRQVVHQYNGIPLQVSHPPAYLLINPVDKKESWQDLLRVKKIVCS